jgi:hypothetical protein
VLASTEDQVLSAKNRSQAAGLAGARSSRELRLIRTLWREVLGVETVADDVNFFAAGGDSLLLVSLVELIRRATGQPVKTMDVLRAATVTGQAELVAALAGAS